MQKINTEIYLKKKKIKRENMEKIDMFKKQSDMFKKTKTKRISKQLS